MICEVLDRGADHGRGRCRIGVVGGRVLPFLVYRVLVAEWGHPTTEY